MTKPDFAPELKRLSDHYTRLLQEKGDTPEAMQWSSLETQHRRFEALLDGLDLAGSSLLDFGCGSGHLLSYLKSRQMPCGEYAGYDISEDAIALAKAKHPEAAFEVRNIFDAPPDRLFDCIICCGPFNNRMQDNWRFLTESLKALFTLTSRSLRFNLLSTYVDYRDDELSYIDPGEIFRYCKENLSPLVVLRHDYLVKPGVIPFEFMVEVKQSEIKPVCWSAA